LSIIAMFLCIAAKKNGYLMGEMDECLCVAINLYGTNLDARGARRVSGMDATNQFSSTPNK